VESRERDEDMMMVRLVDFTPFLNTPPSCLSGHHSHIDPPCG
jgi:hypothetical protein